MKILNKLFNMNEKKKLYGYNVTFYFVSGNSVNVEYQEKEKEELLKKLRINWENLSCATNEWGINFAHVTHYEIEKIEN